MSATGAEPESAAAGAVIQVWPVLLFMLFLF